MSKYEVVSGKHIVLSRNKGKTRLRTYGVGESFEADPCQVKNIMDKLIKVAEKEQKIENREIVDDKKREKEKEKFSRREKVNAA